MRLRIKDGQTVKESMRDMDLHTGSVRDMDLHTGRLEEHTSIHSEVIVRTLGCSHAQGFLVLTVRHPDPFLYICRVLGENCKKLTRASGLWLPSPRPHACRQEEERGAPWTDSEAHYSKLLLFMDLLTHP